MSSLTTEPLTRLDRRTMNTGIIHQHYRVIPGFPRIWSAQCKVCGDVTTKAMSANAAERPMIQHLKDKHDITVEVDDE